ncbi:NAD-dependent epimerase/dehydratase family protein [Microvirga alba]|uniref:NAD-dependent epimerase/dehydratase family protein n=1 Tax=Microvirga alba TaxID=2791025 RepID=A0A931FPY8_9HYPH|nr:NAD-dependent epimerase/dehydratase family protein [Microvirga alba]MBF9232928.1 NAD-dependent epimerase/dehydratase family protein [Microvirga alba]
MAAPRILVTGASGFIGACVLAPLQARGFSVHTLGRRTPEGPFEAHHQIDLMDAAAIDTLLAALRPSHVLHLAWFAEHGRFWTAPENLDWVAATLTLGRLAARHGVERFVGVGTCAEYDWSDGGSSPRRESDALAPATLYGRAKAVTAAHLEALFADEGVSFAWARMFHLFGANEPSGKLVASILASLRSGQKVELRAGAAIRDYIPVQHAGGALTSLVAANVTGPVNLASGQSVRISEIAGLLAQLTGREDLFDNSDRPLPPGEIPAMLADVTKLRREAGAPEPPPLIESLRQLCAEAGNRP